MSEAISDDFLDDEGSSDPLDDIRELMESNGDGGYPPGFKKGGNPGPWSGTPRREF